jgi:hypothetical protein
MQLGLGAHDVMYDGQQDGWRDSATYMQPGHTFHKSNLITGCEICENLERIKKLCSLPGFGEGGRANGSGLRPAR